MTRKQLTDEWRKQLRRGDLVEYEGNILPVLGYAASLDSNGNPMVEIAWNNKVLSPISGYLAVSRTELNLPARDEEQLDQ